jgi:hypothetical protein
MVASRSLAGPAAGGVEAIAAAAAAATRAAPAGGVRGGRRPGVARCSVMWPLARIILACSWPAGLAELFRKGGGR